MRRADLERRIEALEERAGLGAVTYAVGFSDGRGDEIEIAGTGERMTRAEFEQRYPNGVIAVWLEEELWEAL